MADVLVHGEYSSPWPPSSLQGTVGMTPSRHTGPATAGITISIVSHAQMHLVLPLLHDLNILHASCHFQVVLTLNTTEARPFNPEDFAFPLQVLRNAIPRGFGANHNRAFTYAHGAFFCVLNPDIRISQNPFPELMRTCAHSAIGIAAPTITNALGQQEDSARKFPTPLRIAQRVLTRRRARDYAPSPTTLQPDWVGGMFMLLRTPVYQQLGGFDERYFLYYEDVDLCARARLAGFDIVQIPLQGVVHEAQRASHRDARYLRWHVGSMMRFFCSKVFLRLQWRHITGQR